MDYIITESQKDMTIRDFLKKEIRLSTKLTRTLKYTENGITVNGMHKTVRYILQANDVLSLSYEDTETQENIVPSPLPLDILYEDAYIILPNKPAQMPTHPSHDHHDDTVANALAYRFLKEGIPFHFRPINRLDRNTSGLLLIAKDRKTAQFYAEKMQKKEIAKTYLAIVDGEMTERSGRIDRSLMRTEESIILRTVCNEREEEAQRAVTDYTVLAVGNGHTLLQLMPKTGRTHQLRVHLSSIGHPITGDDLYGGKTEVAKRHMLHAHTLTFPEMTGETPITVTAPLPNDFKTLLHDYFPEYSDS